MAPHPELARVEKQLERHIKNYERLFVKQGKLPRDKDWRPFRAAVRDVVIGVFVLRHQVRDNIIEVDVWSSVDPDGFTEEWTGTRIGAIFVLSEAYKCGSSMGIRFTSNFGKNRERVPSQLFDLASDYDVILSHVDEGVITPKEARMLYLALTEFSEEAERRIMELAVAYKVTPERICYMVHHLTYTKEEMESILLGSEFPEHVLLGKITPEEPLLYVDVVLRARAAVLGGSLDRKLRQKEIVREDGTVVDLEGVRRQMEIGFDPRFFAKVYDLQEETPLPWTGQETLLPSGDRLVVMVRERDSTDFEYWFKDDLAAAGHLLQAFEGNGQTHFGWLVPRNVLELPEEKLQTYRERIESLGVHLMVCPESVHVLDTDVRDRLRESETMRHDVGSFQPEETAETKLPRLDFNATSMVAVSLPSDLKIGRLQLSKLVEQAVYDERELLTGVNKHNVRARYHLVCDRMQFLAYQALSQKHYVSVGSPVGPLAVVSSFAQTSHEWIRLNRLAPIFLTPDQLDRLIVFLRGYNERHGLGLEDILSRLEAHAAKREVAVIVQNKHVRQSEEDIPSSSREEESLAQAFAGQFVPDWVNDFDDVNIREVIIKQLWRAANSARRGQSNVVNLGILPHEGITEALNHMVYKQPDDFEGPVYVNIVYTDGTQAEPFPLFALKRPPAEAVEAFQKKALQQTIGMVSMRHPDMDRLINQYWFRNIEISQPELTQAEQDALCYEITRKKLQAIIDLNRPIRIWLLQTGLQPAVVGFYRAVVEFLREHREREPMLEVIPAYYRKDREDSYEDHKTGNRNPPPRRREKERKEPYLPVDYDKGKSWI